MRVITSPFNLDRLQREVNILLISDLHYDISREKAKDDWMRGPIVNDNMVSSLAKEPEDWEPDILIVAGDLVNQNRPENYIHYVDLIKKLTHRFPNLRNTYFSTPGNHDINRENIVSVFPYLYQLQQKDPSLEIENSFTSNPVVDAIYTIAKESINDSPLLGEALAAFEKEYFKTYLSERDKLYKEILYPPQVEEIFKDIGTVYYKSILGITLLSLNSSFFCNLSQTGQDRNNLFLIRGLIEEVKNKLEFQNGPIVTFMHHPYYYLHESEHIAPASLNGKSDKQNNFTKLVKISDLILSGHVHGELHDPTFLQHHAYMITNGTSYTTDTFEGKCYPYTYALIKINKQLGKFSIRKFKYTNQQHNAAEPYGYQCMNHNTSRFYQFFEREDAEGTSVETEKVRVLRYFKECDLKSSGKINEFSYFIFQLRLHDKAMNDPDIEYGYKIIKQYNEENLVDEITYGENIIWIYRMEKITHLRDIQDILSSQADDFPEESTVYFSINMDLLYDNDVPSRKKIENLRKTYQALVLSKKIEKVSIALLYH